MSSMWEVEEEGREQYEQHESARPPKYPEIEVSLLGRDGNAFAVMGAVTKALRRAGVPSTEIDAYRREATAGDYDHLLRVTMEWVEVY